MANCWALGQVEVIVVGVSRGGADGIKRSPSNVCPEESLPTTAPTNGFQQRLPTTAPNDGLHQRLPPTTSINGFQQRLPTTASHIGFQHRLPTTASNMAPGSGLRPATPQPAGQLLSSSRGRGLLGTIRVAQPSACSLSALVGLRSVRIRFLFKRPFKGL